MTPMRKRNRSTLTVTNDDDDDEKANDRDAQHGDNRKEEEDGNKVNNNLPDNVNKNLTRTSKMMALTTICVIVCLYQVQHGCTEFLNVRARI